MMTEVKKEKKKLERLVKLIKKYSHVYCKAYYEKNNPYLISERMHQWETEFMTFENAWSLRDNEYADWAHNPIKVEAWKQYMVENPEVHKDMNFGDLISA